MFRLLVFASLTVATGYAARPVPIDFEANEGQTDPVVRFLTRGPGFTLFLTDDGPVLALHKTAGKREILRLRMPGANARPQIEGVDVLPGKVNYFRGPDRSKWRTGVSLYRQVRYRDVYPGIDAVYYGNGDQLEFDLVVTPGADLSLIRFRVEGASRLSLDADGNLIARARSGQARLGRPVVYQCVQGRNEPVAGRYRLSRGEARFEVAAYDRTRELVIDPQLYATYLGGTGVDIAAAVTVDTAGSAYVTGYTQSIDFPHPSSPYKSSLIDGDADAFVTKFNPQGTGIVYSTYLGGVYPDYGRAIAVDLSGFAYVTGATVGRFPTTAGAFKEVTTVSPAIFVAKLDSTGGTLSYSTYLDGAGTGYGIAVDSSGNAYVTGYTYTATFSTTGSAFQPRYGGATDAFVTKLNPTGSGLVYSTFLGGSSEDQGTAIAVDGNGSAHITGYTSSSNFPKTSGAYRTTLAGGADAFLTKLNPAGTALVYSTYLGGTSTDRGHGIAVNLTGEAFVTGQTYSLNFPVSSGAYQTVHSAGGGANAFVTRFNNTGTGVLYSTLLGGPNPCTLRDAQRLYQCDSAYAIAIDSSNNAYITGAAGPAFPITMDATQPANASTADAFITELNPTGTALVYSSYLGGSQPDVGLGLVYDSTSASPIAVGFTNSSNFPASSNAYQATAPGGASDAFLARLVPCSVSLSSSSSFFPATSGNYAIGVTASSGCGWSAATDVGWVTITTGAGTGNGSISFTVAANPGVARVGHITVGGATFTLQQVSGVCASPATPSSWFPASAGSYSLGIIASCAWSASTTAPWINITSGAGSGNGQVLFSLTANTGTSSRSGQIDISGGSSFTVNQVGGAAPQIACGYSLSAVSEDVPVSGAFRSVNVTVAEGCPWMAHSAVEWILITSGATGLGNGAVSYAVASNSTGLPRFANISIGFETLTVVQQP